MRRVFQKVGDRGRPDADEPRQMRSRTVQRGEATPHIRCEAASAVRVCALVQCVRRCEQPNGSVKCPTCRVVCTAACITKSWSMIKLLEYQQKKEASTRINKLLDLLPVLRRYLNDATALLCDTAITFLVPKVCVPLGSSLTESEFKGLRGLIGGQVKLKSIYRTSLHGSAHRNVLRCVGDKRGLAFVIRKNQYVFGAFISDGLQEPTRPE
ncbi:unnamed protein product [Vitrella brassicaformis CCMP3155]|uniref:TLDc domain-containing protein n=1 Tax=Vitrella brassicaformis (strain CCMP3155) TaxID=1169540 RepID=A0A0G4G0D8_VITBC|nr:unnamed protein product [Vitrella brassicaformis CCMP3155]|eukprot:CEM21154.1 unnamed protein product [Vitrella brassicaformis CCMP3155]